MIEVFGAPFDGGGALLGSRLGPAALELAGLKAELEALGLAVAEWNHLPFIGIDCPHGGLEHFTACYAAVERLSHEIAGALQRQNTVIAVGGEHSISMGSVAAALNATEGDLAVLWIDAHADLNTPASSLTGHLHGMPLAALAGLPSGREDLIAEQWSKLTALTHFPLKPQNIIWLGLRDVDPSEAQAVNASGGLALTMHDVDRNGIESTVRRFEQHLQDLGVQNLWISFDVDVLDPNLAPGTGTAVRGGLTYREAHLMAELLHEGLARMPQLHLVGLDLVEINPLEDVRNTTARVVAEWTASLFGKSILGAH